MSLRPILRPLPLFIIVVFVAVAAVDLVQTVREEPSPPPVVLTPDAVRFEPWEPVVDLRHRDREPGVAILPVPVFVGELWSEAGESGRWLLGDGAELVVDLIRGDQRLLVFEGRPAGGRRPVRRMGITVNGAECSMASLRRGWQRWSAVVPEGVLHPGSNQISFRIPDREGVRRPRRALQLRRIEFRGDRAPDRGGSAADPVTVDFEAQQLVMRTPGVLEARFEVDDRIDALRMKYRLDGSGGSGWMTVARPQGGGVGRDAEIRRALSRSDKGRRSVRVPLHGRRGDFVLRLEVESEAPRFEFDVKSLELVTERNRSGILHDPRDGAGHPGRPE